MDEMSNREERRWTWSMFDKLLNLPSPYHIAPPVLYKLKFRLSVTADGMEVELYLWFAFRMSWVLISARIPVIGTEVSHRLYQSVQTYIGMTHQNKPRPLPSYILDFFCRKSGLSLYIQFSYGHPYWIKLRINDWINNKCIVQVRHNRTFFLYLALVNKVKQKLFPHTLIGPWSDCVPKILFHNSSVLSFVPYPTYSNYLISSLI
jgi:hypothetical protein